METYEDYNQIMKEILNCLKKIKYNKNEIQGLEVENKELKEKISKVIADGKGIINEREVLILLDNWDFFEN